MSVALETLQICYSTTQKDIIGEEREGMSEYREIIKNSTKSAVGKVWLVGGGSVSIGRARSGRSVSKDRIAYDRRHVGVGGQ